MATLQKGSWSVKVVIKEKIPTERKDNEHNRREDLSKKLRLRCRRFPKVCNNLLRESRAARECYADCWVITQEGVVNHVEWKLEARPSIPTNMKRVVQYVQLKIWWTDWGHIVRVCMVLDQVQDPRRGCPGSSMACDSCVTAWFGLDVVIFGVGEISYKTEF